MRILWFACTPSCYDVKTIGGWVEALECIVRTYIPEIELGIAFEHTDKTFKVVRDKVTYYPICYQESKKEKLKNKFQSSSRRRFECLRPLFLKVLHDFNPDVVQCFGTELWHYSLLQRDTNIPFVIHIMGFGNIYNMMGDIVSKYDDNKSVYNPLIKFKKWKFRLNMKEHEDMEYESMNLCRHFMGRTEWDKAIVRHFAPNANYHYCPEAIRDEIYNSTLRWKFRYDNVIRLITISNAGTLKGNEIMLRVAWLLKNKFGKKLEWRVTSTPDSMARFERNTGIKCKDVGIKLIGRLKVTDIPNAICNSEMFIHCAIIDNSPNAICEAQLIGCPIIATNAGGIPQIVTDGETGFLYPYAEPYALAFKILELHNNEILLNRVSNGAYKIAHERHNPKRIAERVMEIYKNILQE